MKRAHHWSLLLTALVLCTMSWNAQAQLAYRLQQIHDPSSPSDVHPEGLNNKGEVIGTAWTNGARGFHWKNGVYTDLQTATGSTATRMHPTSINDRSIIVGDQDVEPRNFMIRKGQLLPLQIETSSGASVIAINNRNQVVGRAESSVFIWERGTTTYLPRLPDSDDYVTTANDINDGGVVAGISGSVHDRYAVIWKDGVVIALDPPEETVFAQAKAINNFNQVVGEATGQPGVTKAFLWDSGTRELPAPAGATAPIVWSINDWGAAVGESTMSQDGAVHATLWVSGQAHDLNDLLDANEPLRDQILLVQAIFINERGQIVAYGVDQANGSRAAYLLTPTYRALALP